MALWSLDTIQPQHAVSLSNCLPENGFLRNFGDFGIYMLPHFLYLRKLELVIVGIPVVMDPY